jgi:putative ABC transport system substrate-binding protein
MRRRDFIAGLGGAAVVGPRGAWAQQGERVRRVGVLSGYGATDPEGQLLIAAFRDELRKLGWVEGSVLAIEVRYAVAANPALMETYAADLLALKPDVVLVHGRRALSAVQRKNPDMPVVFAALADPVGTGAVQSLARPGANVTGFAIFEGSPVGKVVEALKEMAPRVVRVALAYNPDLSTWTAHWRLLESVASSFAITPIAMPVRNPFEIEQAIAAFAVEPNGGLVVQPDTTLITHRAPIIEMAARHRLPAAYSERLYVIAGGLLSYGVDVSDNYRHAASYIDRILKGARPADLPVQQPTKFQLALNLKTARALGLTVPATLLARADEVIE